MNFLLRPALQLKLPFYLLAVTLGFVGLWAAQAYVAYETLLVSAFEDTVASEGLKHVLRFQTRDFASASAMMGVAYVLLILGISIYYAHKMVGPTVAFRRHVQALKRGDYSKRVQLRAGDAFGDLARELNELAETLEKGDVEAESDGSPPLGGFAAS